MPLLPPPRDVVVVHWASSEFEAHTIAGVLQDAGLRVMVRSRLVSGYDLPSVPGVWGEVLVPPEQEDEARRLIADYMSALDTEAELDADAEPHADEPDVPHPEGEPQ
jgi:hypothetical protein